jgi:hypothetical protein
VVSLGGFYSIFEWLLSFDQLLFHRSLHLAVEKDQKCNGDEPRRKETANLTEHLNARRR